jgi:O-antigen/teichoic acid export membrane protein
MVVAILVARYLGPADMGRYAFLMWLIDLIVTALCTGLPTTLTRYTAEALAGDQPWIAGVLLRAIARWQFAASLAASALLAAAGWAPWVDPQWRMLLLLGAASIPSLVLSASLAGFLAGMQAFGLQARLARLAVGQLVLQVSLVLGVVTADLGTPGIVGAHLIANSVYVVAAAHFARRLGQKRGAFDRSEALPERTRQDVLRYARDLIYLVLLDAIVWQRSEVVFLQQFSTSAEVAYYAVAFGLVFQVSRIPYQASTVVFPAFAESVGRGGSAALGDLHVKSLRVMVLIGAPIFVGLAVVAPQLVLLLYGASYAPAAPVLRILALGGLISSFALASPAVLHATKATRLLVRQALIAAGVDIGVAVVLTPLFGALGAALANTTAQGVASILVIAVVVRLTARQLVPGPLARILGASVVMGCLAVVPLALASGSAGLAGSVAVGVIGYVVALRLFRALTSEDADRLMALWRAWPSWLRSRADRLAAFLCGGASGG